MKKGLAGISKYKEGGVKIPFVPGESMDDYISKRNTTFLEYISKSTQAAIMTEAKTPNKGMLKARTGTEVPPLQPVTLTGPGADNNYSAYYNHGLYQALQTPGYVQGMQVAASPYSDFGLGDATASGGVGKQNIPSASSGPNVTSTGADTDTAAPQGAIDDRDEKDAKKQLIKTIASKVLTTVPKGLNALYGIGEAQKNAEQLDASRTVENTASSSYGKRGNYNINSGAFRQNIKTTPYYALGGNALLKNGTAMEVFDGYVADIKGDGQGTFDSVWGGKSTMFDRGDPLRLFGQGGDAYNLYGSLGQPMIGSQQGGNSKAGTETVPLQNEVMKNGTAMESFDGYVADIEGDGAVGGGIGRHLSGRPMLKKGGTYKMTHADILRMKSEGYEFDILD